MCVCGTCIVVLYQCELLTSLTDTACLSVSLYCLHSAELYISALALYRFTDRLQVHVAGAMLLPLMHCTSLDTCQYTYSRAV